MRDRRHLVVILAIATLATPALASWWPAWSTREVDLQVGETTIVQIKPTWSGLVDYGNGVHWTFRSDDERVALAYARLDDSKPYDMEITAVGPGIALIRQEYNGLLSDYGWVRILVTCAIEPPVRAAVPVLTTRPGVPVILAAETEIASRTSFVWYHGRQGDRSHRIEASGPVLRFVPETPGTKYVWVEAITPCSISTAEFRIETGLPRRRAVAH